MKNRLIDAVKRYDMLREGDTAVVGLSGGADSCALLHLLYTLRGELGINVEACHINHSLRGAESDRDEAFVRSLCGQLGVELEVRRVDVRGSAGKHESIEEAARRLRYEVFSAYGERGCRIATAHTASDSAETVLMNIVRGTGTKGLAGIPPVRDMFIRPLIFCTREQTEEYCAENGISYVTDSTNLIDDCTRNRIRHNVIPLLKELNPSFIGAVTRMTAAVGDDEAFLSRYSAQCGEQCRAQRSGHTGYDCRRLSVLDPAVRFRVIASELRRNGVEPSALRVSQCEEIIAKGAGKVNLQKNKFALVRKKIFYVMTEQQNYR